LVDDTVRLRRDDAAVEEHGPDQAEQSAVDLDALSEREREVLGLALAGLSARAIAERLTLTEATVRSHLSRIYAKTGVGGRVELLARANGHAPAPDAAGALPFEPAGSPPRRRRRLRSALVAGTVVALGAALAFLVLRPDLPPRTDVATVSGLIAEGQVTSLDLRGDTLFVATADGRHYRVEGAGAATAETLQAAALATGGVSVSGGGDTLATSVAIVVTAVAPLVLLLVGVLLLGTWLRGRPRPAPSA
jgi:DNA-binding CsgD family transcriptional regulator